MNIEFTSTAISSALAELAKKDTDFKIFGADGHEYWLNTPLSSSTLDEFEDENSLSLPTDYKYFITSVGNGGAGPAYGLFEFGKQDADYGFRKWKGGYLVGDFSKPFPHIETWNGPEEMWAQRPDFDACKSEEEEEECWERWEELLEKHYWDTEVVDGAIPICHLGCAYRQWLIINGPQAGYVWNDDRADEKGLSPLTNENGIQITFTAWYLDWLNGALAQVGIQ